MAVKFCSNCGKALKQGVKFCGNCGNKIGDNIAENFVQKESLSIEKADEQDGVSNDRDKRRITADNVETNKIHGSNLAVSNESLLSNKKETISDITNSISEIGKEKLNNVEEQIFTVKNKKMANGLKEKFFISEGRVDRWTYFIESLKLFGIMLLAALLSSTGVLAIIGIPLMIAVAVSGIMLSIRRWHDLNRSGWFVLLNCIPYFNILVGLYILFAKGTAGPNIYGNDPSEMK